MSLGALAVTGMHGHIFDYLAPAIPPRAARLPIFLTPTARPMIPTARRFALPVVVARTECTRPDLGDWRTHQATKHQEGHCPREGSSTKRRRTWAIDWILESFRQPQQTALKMPQHAFLPEGLDSSRYDKPRLRHHSQKKRDYDATGQRGDRPRPPQPVQAFGRLACSPGEAAPDEQHWGGAGKPEDCEDAGGTKRITRACSN